MVCSSEASFDGTFGAGYPYAHHEAEWTQEHLRPTYFIFSIWHPGKVYAKRMQGVNGPMRRMVRRNRDDDGHDGAAATQAVSGLLQPRQKKAKAARQRRMSLWGDRSLRIETWAQYAVCLAVRMYAGACARWMLVSFAK